MTGRPTAALLLIYLGTAASGHPLFAQCPDGTPPPCSAPVVAPPTSVAVLYFKNLSRDTADLYLAEGLTEEIATSLGRIGRLRVMGSSAVRRVQPRMRNDPAAIGRALKVRYLLDGTVQPSGGFVRVRVQLVNAVSSTQVWSNAYSRPLDDILAMQEEIARDVVVNVTGTLLSTERVLLAVRPAPAPQVYDHFLQGNFYLARRTNRSLQRAVTEYETALRHDPAFSRARARLAYALALTVDWGWTRPGVAPEDLVSRGLALADTAIAAEPTNSEAWMARGYLLEFRNRKTFDGVTDAFARAVALDSTNAEAWHQYGSALGPVGAHPTAIAAFRRALALDPGRSITWLELSTEVTVTGNTREGLALLDSAVATDPTSGIYLMTRAEQLLLLGDSAAARADAEGAVRLDPDLEPERSNIVARIFAAAGDTIRARATLAPNLNWLRDLLARTTGLMHPPGNVVYSWVPALLAIGERDLALRYLEAHRAAGVRLWYYRHFPTCDPLQTEPRFQALVSASNPGLPERN